MKEALEILLSKYNFPKKAVNLDFEIERIENYFKQKLPKDYIFFLKYYSAFEDFINVEYVKLWSSEELVKNNKAYEIQKYMPKTIGIGSNGNGEIIAIEFNDLETSEIVLAPIDLDAEYNITIGKNFTDFLNRLDNEQGWFD